MSCHVSLCIAKYYHILICIAIRHPSMPMFIATYYPCIPMLNMYYHVCPYIAVCRNYCHVLLCLPAPVLADEVSKLINYFVANHTRPLEWESGSITTVTKICTKRIFRPVLILTVLSKMFEEILRDQIYCVFINHFSLNLWEFHS